MKQFKIRCSAIVQIMTNPRAKKDVEAGLLSATTKTYYQDWYKEQLYKRRKTFSNKYVQKGFYAHNDWDEIQKDFYDGFAGE